MIESVSLIHEFFYIQSRNLLNLHSPAKPAVHASVEERPVVVLWKVIATISEPVFIPVYLGSSFSRHVGDVLLGVRASVNPIPRSNQPAIGVVAGITWMQVQLCSLPLEEEWNDPVLKSLRHRMTLVLGCAQRSLP